MNILKNVRAVAIALAYCAMSGCGKGDSPSGPGTSAATATSSLALSAWQASAENVQLAWVSEKSAAVMEIVHIYRDNVLLGSDAESPWTDSTIVGGKDYTYRIVTIDNAGNEITWSNPVTIHTLAPAVKIVPVVHVAPASAAIAIGDSIRVVPSARDSATSAPVDSSTTVFATSDSSVARVSSSGWVYGRAQGQVNVKASLGSASSSSAVIVLPAATLAVDTVAASLTIFPSPVSVQVGAAAGLQAVIQTSSGAIVAGHGITWSSSNTAVATVSSTGAIVGVAVGTATITATSGSVGGSVPVTVFAAPVAAPAPPVTPIVATVSLSPTTASVNVGATVSLAASPKDALGSLLNSAITWSSTNTSVATVSASGVVTGVSAGNVTILATVGGISGAATITVNAPSQPAQPAAVASVSLSSTNLSLVVGSSGQITATARDASGTALTGRTITWSSNNAAIAAVSSTGSVTAVSVGTATITATSEGMSASVTVVVTAPAPAPVVSVSIGGGNALLIGATLQLSATPLDALGNLLGGLISWSSSNTAVATVSAGGAVTGVAAGTATITATVAGISGTVNVTVSAPSPAPVASITLSSTSASVVAGATAQLTATPRDAQGTALVGRTITWVSNNVSVASVSATGLVTGIAAGTTTITVTSGGISADVTITVTAAAPAAIVSISLSQTSVSLTAGTSSTLIATARDLLGNLLLGRTITWTTSNSSVATVSAGMITGVSAGTATITATGEGISASVTVTVTAAAPAPIASISLSQLSVTVGVSSVATVTATPRDLLGNLLTGRVITWASNNTGVATVSASGVITGVAAGMATVTATGEGISASVVVTVTPTAPAPIATLGLSQLVATVAVGATASVSATARDAQGNVLAGRVITWASNSTGVATVSASGTITGVSAGLATITATGEGTSASLVVTVIPAPISTISLSQLSVTVVAGATATVTATARDLLGNLLTGRVITWSSNNTAVATVSASGIITGVGAGTATITATGEGISTSVTVTVTAAPPAAIATISLSQITAIIAAGGTASVSATPRDAQGNVLTGRVIAWTSDNTAAATVSASGVITAVATGVATVTATGEGISASIIVTVIPAAVASVSINTGSGSLCVAGSLQLSATPRDAQGNALTGRSVVWTSSNPTIASISTNGLVLGLVLGSTTLTATIDGVSASVNLTLCPPLVATVSISGNNGPLSLLTGLLMPLTATAYDANGHVITGRTVSWSVTPSIKALISSLGILTPLSLGSVTVTATIDGITASTSVSILP